MSANARQVRVYLIHMRNKMKLIKNILVFLAAALATGCSGTVDDSTIPVLKAGADEIDLAETESVELTVLYEGVDVTSESAIFVNGSDPVSGNIFTPDGPGSYVFHAEYDGKQSNSVTVNVIDTDVKVESKYERHVSLIEFTGAWCINCPDGFQKMMLTLSKPSMEKYVDNVHICAFHSNLEGKDDMAIPETQDVFRMFKGLAYPSFVTDLRNVEGSYGILTDDGSANLQPSIVASFEDYPAHCGVAVASAVDAASNEASVSVSVSSELTSEYRVIVLVVEDKVVGPQKTTTYPDGKPDYIHKHVVRQVVTEYAGTFAGEKLTDDGRISVGQEVSKTWKFALDSRWNPDNTEIYALVLDKDGHVNNMNVCPLVDGNSGYNLKK